MLTSHGPITVGQTSFMYRTEVALNVMVAVLPVLGSKR